MKNFKEKILVSASATIIDWMDFSIFALITPILCLNFFPKSEVKKSYLLAMFIFSAAYIARPLGGYFFAQISNAYNKKTSLKISTLVMSLCSFCIACLPTYHKAGYIGAWLFLAIRVIQGLVIGGQYPTSFILLSEDKKQRYPYLMSNINSVFAYLGIIIGQYFTIETTYILSKNSMFYWGWRALFLFSGCLSLSVYLTQKKIVAPVAKKNITANKLSLVQVKKNIKKLVFVFLVIFLLGTEYFSTIVTMPNYFLLNHYIDLKQSIAMKTILSVTALVLTVFFAYIGDVFKLKYSLLVMPVILILLISIVMPEMHVNYRLKLFQYGCLEIMILLYCASVAVIYPIITQLFSVDSRNTLVALGYGIGNTVAVLVSINLISFLCLKMNTLTPCFMIISFSSIVFLIYFFRFYKTAITARY